MRIAGSCAPTMRVGDLKMTAAYCAAQGNRLKVIRLLHEMRADLDKPNTVDGQGPTAIAAQQGADDCVRLLAHLGARFIEPAAPDWTGGPFWRHFKDNTTRVRNPKVWEWIVSKGGDKGTEKSLQKRIKLLKQAGLEDPRDENRW